MTIERAYVQNAIDALDALEQLLELLRGPLNGGEEMFVDDLIQAVQDGTIVSARMPLAWSLRVQRRRTSRRLSKKTVRT